MKAMDPDVAWRPLIGALANDDALVVFARLVLEGDVNSALDTLAPKKRARVLGALVRGGLVSDPREGPLLRRIPDAFTQLLEAAPIRRRVGIDRFLRDGRLDQYPANPDERREVLSWIVERVLEPGEVVSEAQINERLTVFTRDFATLRRYLVDFEFLERTRYGTSYMRVVP